MSKKENEGTKLTNREYMDLLLRRNMVVREANDITLYILYTLFQNYPVNKIPFIKTKDGFKLLVSLDEEELELYNKELKEEEKWGPEDELDEMIEIAERYERSVIHHAISIKKHSSMVAPDVRGIAFGADVFVISQNQALNNLDVIEYVASGIDGRVVSIGGYPQGINLSPLALYLYLNPSSESTFYQLAEYFIYYTQMEDKVAVILAALMQDEDGEITWGIDKELSQVLTSAEGVPLLIRPMKKEEATDEFLRKVSLELTQEMVERGLAGLEKSE